MPDFTIRVLPVLIPDAVKKKLLNSGHTSDNIF